MVAHTYRDGQRDESLGFTGSLAYSVSSRPVKVPISRRKKKPKVNGYLRKDSEVAPGFYNHRQV